MITKFKGLTLLACAFTMVGPVHAQKLRAGSVESELAIQDGILDGVKSRLAYKKKELENYRQFQAIADELEEAGRALAAINEEIKGLEEQEVIAGDELSSVQLSFEEYRDQYRKSEREAAVGVVLDLSETKGESYQECKVLGISALHLRVARPSGTEGIPFQDLPPHIQDRFQFDEEEAAIYAAMMAKSDAARAKAYSDWQASKANGTPAVVSSDLAGRLAQMEKLSLRTNEESARLRKLSDDWREKAARYWKSVSDAKSASARQGRERIASRAESKADQYLEHSKAARLEASRLDGAIRELKDELKKAGE